MESSRLITVPGAPAGQGPASQSICDARHAAGPDLEAAALVREVDRPAELALGKPAGPCPVGARGKVRQYQAAGAAGLCVRAGLAGRERDGAGVWLPGAAGRQERLAQEQVAALSEPLQRFARP